MFKKQKITFLYISKQSTSNIIFKKKTTLNISVQCYYSLQTRLLYIIHSKKRQ